MLGGVGEFAGVRGHGFVGLVDEEEDGADGHRDEDEDGAHIFKYYSKCS